MYIGYMGPRIFPLPMVVCDWKRHKLLCLKACSSKKEHNAVYKYSQLYPRRVFYTTLYRLQDDQVPNIIFQLEWTQGTPHI
jgi:hypothetical protein